MYVTHHPWWYTHVQLWNDYQETNKRPMGHIVHLRNQFKSMSEYIWEKFWLIVSNFFNVFMLFQIISPWKRAWPFIWTNLKIPFTQGCFVPSLVEIGPVVLEKMKMWKVTTTTTRATTTDYRQIVNRKAHLSLQLRWVIGVAQIQSHTKNPTIFHTNAICSSTNFKWSHNVPRHFYLGKGIWNHSIVSALWDQWAHFNLQKVDFTRFRQTLSLDRLFPE